MATPINPSEARRLWVERLESGTVEKGYGSLADGNKRCCLGVACDIAVEAGVIDSYVPQAADLATYRQVQRLFGLKSPIGRFSTTKMRGSLASLNDAGVPFEEIAKVIRAEPEGLFDAA